MEAGLLAAIVDGWARWPTSGGGLRGLGQGQTQLGGFEVQVSQSVTR